MAVLSKKFKDKNRVSPADSGAVVTGEEAKKDGAEEEKILADRPIFIYVSDPSESEGFDKVEKVILDDNKVLISMWAFDCVKMTPEDVENDPLLSDEGKDVPRFIFVSRDYENVKVLEGSNLKTKKVATTMEKFASKAYKTNFKKQVKATLKLLLEFDKINNAKKTLNAKKERLGADGSKNKLDKIDKELAELEEAQKKADEKKTELLTFKLREAS